LLAACSGVRIPEPVVVLDPEAVDLGFVRAGSQVQRRITVADVGEGAQVPRLLELRLTGEGADWIDVAPVVPLPADLQVPLPVAVTAVAVPVDARLGAYELDLVAFAEVGDTEVEVAAVVTFEVRSCDEDADGALAEECGGTDCNDEDPTLRPGAEELCNEIDDDCNGLVDDARDVDGDGFGRCDDCDDNDFRVNPAGIEVCNGIDDDCDGFVGLDEADLDGDGVPVCDRDCDDRDPARFPGAAELCNNIDDNCNSVIDDVPDADRDGFDLCDDCDDTDEETFPGATEVCDGVDNNCDGSLPADEVDADFDGVSTCQGDCDDTDVTRSPRNAEICNGRDDNCAGDIDEAAACPCERREFEGDVYQFCDTALSWNDAQAQCLAWGYHLLTIDTSREDRAAFRAANGVDATRRWWTGFNDIAVEDTWVWEDGSPVGYTNWNSNEPNDSGSGEDCGQINRYSDGTWNDEPCANSLPYICELD
jgi:hypothetical protein